MRSVSIRADQVHIDFPIYENSDRSLKNLLLKRSVGGLIGVGKSEMRVVHALSGVSFEASPGDRIALLGHNGSGKTTLLRSLAGVYKPSCGHLTVLGQITSLLDVSMGLDPDATGYENIFIRGVLAGISRAEIESQVDVIATFSELGEFLSLPVRSYSSGMMLRLAFAISTNNYADILLMDEWLSVGDEGFMQKAEARLQELVSNASILVIATHDQSLANRICNRHFYLSAGQIVKEERH